MSAPLRVVHAVPAIAHEASGPSYSVPALCEALASSGADVASPSSPTAHGTSFHDWGFLRRCTAG
jgi:hypothetical protein